MLAFFFAGRERAQSYSVHEGPQPVADRMSRAEALEFVKDGFVFQAFMLPPLWMGGHGIWLAVGGYAAAAGTILGLASLLGLPTYLVVIAFLALHLLFGSEADEMLRAHLESRGWTMVGQVTGTGPLDCERRFFDQWLPSMPMTGGGLTAGPTRASVPTAPVSDVSTGVPATPAQTALPKSRPSAVLGNLLAPLRRRDGA